VNRSATYPGGTFSVGGGVSVVGAVGALPLQAAPRHATISSSSSVLRCVITRRLSQQADSSTAIMWFQAGFASTSATSASALPDVVAVNERGRAPAAAGYVGADHSTDGHDQTRAIPSRMHSFPVPTFMYLSGHP
jgi:hypothetical protein